MKKMTIAIIFWDLGIGGIQSVIRDFILRLQKTQPTITVVLLIKNNKPSHITETLQRDGFVRICSPRSFPTHDRFIKQIYFFMWLTYMYITVRPDICLTFLDTLSFFAILLKKVIFWRNVRTVLNENVVTSVNNQINKHPVWFWNGITRLLYPLADSIIVPSRACKYDLTSKYSIKESKISVCFNWTSMKRIYRIPKVYDLIYVGRFEKEKNPLALIHLVIHLKKIFPTITLCLVGMGQYEAEMRRKVQSERLQKNILFLGYRSDVSLILNKAKILVMTTQNEGLPIAVIEAGMQAVPCVSTKFLGCEEIIMHNKTGILTNSLEEMADAVQMLLTHTSVQKKLGEHAYTYVSSLFGEKAADKFVVTVLGI